MAMYQERGNELSILSPYFGNELSILSPYFTLLVARGLGFFLAMPRKGQYYQRIALLSQTTFKVREKRICTCTTVLNYGSCLNHEGAQR